MTDYLTSFDSNINVVIIGASGGIGQVFTNHLADHPKIDKLLLLSRSKPSSIPEKAEWQSFDMTDEARVQEIADSLSYKIHLIICATGMLHDDNTQPEKSLRDIDLDNFQKVFATNTHGPALVMKHFLPKMDRDTRNVFCALSARVGSISDNQMGGWYAYRASKAALNMLIKNAAIEVGRRNKKATIVGLHPGTVDTGLSKPFQGNVPEGKLFTAEQSTDYLLKVIDQVDETQTGKCFDWDAKEILP
ncbi:MAG: SDR family NAD(P)-dependent oxidoreductase [Pseudomonadota bacterium]